MTSLVFVFAFTFFSIRTDAGYVARYQDCMTNLAAQNGWSASECERAAKGEVWPGMSADARTFAENSAKEMRDARRGRTKKASASAAVAMPAAQTAPSHQSDEAFATVGILLMVIFGALAYLLPALVASSRNHHQKAAIWILNIFLGWTLLGWVGALVWASTSVRPPSPMPNLPAA